MTIDPMEEFWSPYVAFGNTPHMTGDPTGGSTEFPSPEAARAFRTEFGLTGYTVKAAGEGIYFLEGATGDQFAFDSHASGYTEVDWTGLWASEPAFFAVGGYNTAEEFARSSRTYINEGIQSFLYEQIALAHRDIGVGFSGGEYHFGRVNSRIGRVGSVTKASTPTGKFYSVAYEMTLNSKSYPGVSRYMHFKEANIALSSAIKSNPMFSKLGIIVPRSASGSIIGKSPNEWVWHHNTSKGIMQLVPKSQHPNIPGGIFWETMHPGGVGGFSIWGK